ncbi:MAG: restriction endonuclease [Phycisphaerae bacterium]|nr:restriction endonuclease [Phycisphaerae bacterium]
MLNEFKVNQLYSNEEIFKTLKVSNAGGIRVSKDGDSVEHCVIMTSSPEIRKVNENPYFDRVEGDILTYTAAGKLGDQILSGANKRIPDQLSNDFPIFAFEIIAKRTDKKCGPKRWRFIGLLEYVRHYRENQIDIDGEVRKVWMFEFAIHQQMAIVPVKFAPRLMSEILKDSRANNIYSSDEREIDVESSESESFEKVETVRSKLLTLSPRDFEYTIRDLLIHSGFRDVFVTQYSQDGGIDVNAKAGLGMWPVHGMLMQIQAKRWMHTVGRKEVAELRGSLQPFAGGSVVTTSHFSRAAIKESQEKGKRPIALIDGYHLSEIILGLNFKLPSSE